MRETEITVEVLEEKQTLIDKLINCGFVQQCEFTMHDKYYSPIPLVILKGNNFETIIRNSFLLRTIKEIKESKNQEINLLIYKDKQFDKQGNVVSEEKVQTSLNSTEKHYEIFKKAGFNPYATILSSNVVFKKEEVELVIQDVEGVGIFIEFEEYESISHLPPKEKIEVLKNTLLSLKLSLGTNFSCKKLELYLNKNKL